MTMGNDNTFTILPPEPSFFPFVVHFNAKLWLFMAFRCSSWSYLVDLTWDSIKTEPNTISPNVLWRNTFYFSIKKQLCSDIMPWLQTFLLSFYLMALAFSGSLNRPFVLPFKGYVSVKNYWSTTGSITWSPVNVKWLNFLLCLYVSISVHHQRALGRRKISCI